MKKTKKVGEVIHDVIENKALFERMKKAIDFYKKTQFKNPDKVISALTNLPKIVYHEKTIDLEKEYEGAKIVASMIGVIPFIFYISEKGGEKNVYFHEFKPHQVFLACDPEDNTRVFLVFTEKVKFDETGID